MNTLKVRLRQEIAAIAAEVAAAQASLTRMRKAASCLDTLWQEALREGQGAGRPPVELDQAAKADAREDWENGTVPRDDIAAGLGVAPRTLRAIAEREGWTRRPPASTPNPATVEADGRTSAQRRFGAAYDAAKRCFESGGTLQECGDLLGRHFTSAGMLARREGWKRPEGWKQGKSRRPSTPLPPAAEDAPPPRRDDPLTEAQKRTQRMLRGRQKAMRAGVSKGKAAELRQAGLDRLAADEARRADPLEQAKDWLRSRGFYVADAAFCDPPGPEGTIRLETRWLTHKQFMAEYERRRSRLAA